MKRKQLLIAFAPFLLLLLYPFYISWESMSPKLAKYGLIDNYLFLFSVAISGVLLLDFYVQNKALHQKYNKVVFLSISILTSLILRLLFFNFESLDYQVHLSKWYGFIQENGGFSALQNGDFSDYNPSYLYLMALMSYFPIPKLYAIKLISVLFDYLAAHIVYKIVRLKYPKSSLPLVASVCILFAPTIVINAAMWGQSDMIYSYFILCSLYFLLKEIKNPSEKIVSFLNLKSPTSNILFALLFFTCGLLFKLQAVFFVLPLVYFYAKGKLQLKHLLIGGISLWFLMAIPSFLAGRSFIDLLLIYPKQAVSYPELSWNAPSIYHLIPNAPYEFFNLTGIIFTAFIVLGFLFLFLSKKGNSTQEQFLSLSLISVILIPYLLPKMHERYFFLADILAIIYAFYFPKKWYVPIVMILISLLSYAPFLFGAEVNYFMLLSFALGILITTILHDFLQKTASKDD